MEHASLNPKVSILSRIRSFCTDLKEDGDNGNMGVRMYLFQEVGKLELGFPNHEFIQLW